MTYKDIVMKAKAAGVTNEKTMWQSIESLSELLDELKESHPDLYMKFMREQIGIMYHNHYDEEFALWDVAGLSWTGKDGMKHSGAHWTADQVEQATAGMHFPQSTTKWDKFVAFNVTYSDLSKDFDEAQILKAGFLLYFADEDWGSSTKIWEYMSHKPAKT